MPRGSTTCWIVFIRGFRLAGLARVSCPDHTVPVHRCAGGIWDRSPLQNDDINTLLPQVQGREQAVNAGANDDHAHVHLLLIVLRKKMRISTWRSSGTLITTSLNFDLMPRVLFRHRVPVRGAVG